jgi:hypothetical protein
MDVRYGYNLRYYGAGPTIACFGKLSNERAFLQYNTLGARLELPV